MWGCHIDKPEFLNDINVVNTSSLVSEILKREILPQYEYKVCNRRDKLLYLLVVGIYPH